MKPQHVQVSHDERRKRRKQIAEFIRNGATVPEAARLFKVTCRHVQMSCQEHGVDFATPLKTTSPAN